MIKRMMITILYAVIFVLGIGITTESTSVAAASAFLRNIKWHKPIKVSNFCGQCTKTTMLFLQNQNRLYSRMCLRWHIFHVLLGRNLSVMFLSFRIFLLLLALLVFLVFPAINSVLPDWVSIFIIKFFNKKSQIPLVTLNYLTSSKVKTIFLNLLLSSYHYQLWILCLYV